MAIAIDTTSQSGAWNNAESSVTYSHTCNGSDRVLVVFVTNYAGAVTVSGITYNGTALTQVGTRISYNSSTRWVTAWVLIAPASGANNVVVTLSGTDYVRTMATSLTGAYQTTQPNANSSLASTASGTINQSVTTTNTNMLLWGVDTNATGTSGTGTILLGSGFGELRTHASTASVAAGSNALQLTSVGAIFAGKLVAIEQGAAAGPANVKTFNGLAIASVKTKNGLAIASVKTQNGLA